MNQKILLTTKQRMNFVSDFLLLLSTLKSSNRPNETVLVLSDNPGGCLPFLQKSM